MRCQLIGEIGARRRHPHIVLCRIIKRPVATDAEGDAGRLDEGLHLGLDLAWRRRWRGDRFVPRQTIALGGIEDGVALEERDGRRFLAGLHGALLFVVGDKTISIDDGRAVLALHDVAAERQSLPEGDPARLGKPCSTTAHQRRSTLMPV